MQITPVPIRSVPEVLSVKGDKVKVPGSTLTLVYPAHASPQLHPAWACLEGRWERWREMPALDPGTQTSCCSRDCLKKCHRLGTGRILWRTPSLLPQIKRLHLSSETLSRGDAQFSQKSSPNHSPCCKFCPLSFPSFKWTE